VYRFEKIESKTDGVDKDAEEESPVVSAFETMKVAISLYHIIDPWSSSWMLLL
jgi:hypothetical protein